MINYKESYFNCLCERKHFIRNSVYHLYLMGKQMILSTEKESNHPKYSFEINLQNRIHWQLNEKTHDLEGFGFLYKKEIKYFLARFEDLSQLKSLLSRKIMFRDISDFYTPKSLLGKGGSSKVYLVHSKHDQSKEFASKCIDKSFLKEDGGFQALFMEIEIMRQLEHKNIINLLEIYEGENTFYMILEFLKGKSLHDVVTKSHRDEFSQDIIQTIIRQLLQGIEFIHYHRIIHRDLKPENIMFKEENNFNSLKIVDFGLATPQNIDVYPFPKCGTPGYVAPEVANLKDLTHKYDKVCDIFSIGCIFYKLITRKDLFPGNDYEQILKLNKKCIINIQSLAIYRTPQITIDLIGKMLEVNPNERISAADALQHPFFKEQFQALGVSNNKFLQQQKMKQISQTTTFPSKNTDFPIPIEFKEPPKHKNSNDDCEIVEEEGSSLPKVPIMQKNRRFQMGSFIMKGNIMQIQQDDYPKPMKKFETSDFIDDGHSPSPFTGNHPSFVMHYQSLQTHNFQNVSGNESPFLNSLSPGIFSPSTFQSPGIIKQKYEQDQKNIIPEKANDEEEEKESIHSKHELAIK